MDCVTSWAEHRFLLTNGVLMRLIVGRKNALVARRAWHRLLECPGSRELHNRKTKVFSWYLDLTMIERYWGQERFYHHSPH